MKTKLESHAFFFAWKWGAKLEHKHVGWKCGALLKIIYKKILKTHAWCMERDAFLKIKGVKHMYV